MSRGFGLSFRMYMEGILVPFKSANIICTPNGVEANINIYNNKFIYDLKPKTAVQIFYQDWVNIGTTPGWRLMFDGFLSSYYKEDSATEGRMLSIVCRDFRMDLRKAPAALAYTGDEQLTSRNLFNMQGMYDRTVIKGMSSPQKKGSVATREYENQIGTLGSLLGYIAGTAYGAGAKEDQKNGEWSYSGAYADTPVDKTGKSEGRFFLDALIRGLWVESVGGTSVGVFLNKRTRTDKRFLIPSNRAGFTFWDRQQAGLNFGSYVMMDSRFVSLEVAIMRCAALFMVRIYSCNTPTLIPLSKEINGSNNEALDFIMDENVRKFLVERSSAEFGAPYTLNEAMLLPPLEFTAPPNCNIFLPPLCNRVTWQYDIDADITRGYYSIVDSLSGYDSTQGINQIGIQVPNVLFDLYKDTNKKDQYGRHKPPLTLEERYKGVSLTYNQVNQDLAISEAGLEQADVLLIQKKAAEKRAEIAKLRTQLNSSKLPADKLKALTTEQKRKLDADVNKKIEDTQSKIDKLPGDSTTNAMRRHATIKFINEKYAGRVITVDMMFNPYPMCGFPGLYVDDNEAGGAQSSKTVIGMVQQVKHFIHISAEGAEASTTVVMNDARFIDEPTDVNVEGNALFMKATDKVAAEIDKKTLKYKGDSVGNPYYIPDPHSGTERILDSNYYDLKLGSTSDVYVYAKDFLSLTKSNSGAGASNKFYLDSMYDPQHIPRFYRDVFQHVSDSFMIGKYPDGEETKFFIYDTMHEAVTDMKKYRAELLSEYEAAMKFVMRSICSADAFYQGILGASRLISADDNGKKKYIYVTNTKDFKDSEIDDEYFGVTSLLYDSKDSKIEGLKQGGASNLGPTNGLMTGPGQCSSIMETMPITAMIQERKDAVKKYISETNKTAFGMRFTTPGVK